MVSQPVGTILYVDDDDANRSALSWCFRAAGFTVREAATGNEALRLAEDHPDLVVLDVNLPDIDGFEVCRRIKAHPATRSIPVLHVSASFIRTEDRVHGLDCGADGYLTKPIEPQELVAQARALLRLHEAEEQARAISRQWQSTFDAIRDGVCLLDRAGRVLRCNQAGARLVGRDADAVVGRSWEELTPALELTDAPPFLRMQQTGRREAAELRAGPRWLHLTADPLFEPDGNLSGAVYTLSDVTERKRLEEQLRQAQKMEAVGQLAGGVAHDFNNLLTAITGNVGLLLITLPEQTPGRELLLTVERAAWRAAELTRQLLGFSRRTMLWLKPTDLLQCAQEIVTLLRRTIDPRISVDVQSTPDLWRVEADSGQMNQVLMNLCLNARDAMPDGGRLTLECANVVLDAAAARRHVESRPGDFVRLSVRDTGRGIAPEIQPHIFEPFFTTKEQGKGTGLGLAVVFGIVKQHQGWVECISELGHGARFDIYLPRLEGTPEAAAVPVPTAPTTGSETILVVDDEPAVRDLGRAFLQRHGYQVLTAEDGREAIELYRREQGRIDLVILDLLMPYLSGRDTLHRLREIDPGVRVVLSSGYSGDDTVGMEQEPGVRGFVQKPYLARDLVQAVRAALDQPPVP